MRVAIAAEPRVADLAGLDGSFPWGEARTVAPSDGSLEEFRPDVVFALGGAPRSARIIEPAGAGLWRRAPWPVRDEVYSFALPPEGAPVLVVGDPGSRAPIVEQIEGRNLAVQVRDLIDLEHLQRARVVVFAGEPGAPLPAEAIAPLAAGRVLIVPRVAPAFGLLPGIDHFQYDDPVSASTFADISATFPDALEGVRALGRASARAHLASEVYARFAFDVSLETGRSGS